MLKNLAIIIYFSICSILLSATLLSNTVFKKGIRVDASFPFADECGIILSSKVLTFKENLSNTYNASIIEAKNGYLLIFRHDTTNSWCDTCPYTERQLKMVHLDKNF